MTLRQVSAILLLPGVVLLVIPGLVLWQSSPIRIGWGLPFPWSLILIILAAGVASTGLLLMVRTIALFTKVGQGTLAPWDAPQKLVVQGIYRYVRNPMISGVIGVLLGESMFFGSPQLLVYWGIFVLVNMIYIPLLEEPGLMKRFGEDYAEYKQNVPRWIPRWQPWKT